MEGERETECCFLTKQALLSSTGLHRWSPRHEILPPLNPFIPRVYFSFLLRTVNEQRTGQTTPKHQAARITRFASAIFTLALRSRTWVNRKSRNKTSAAKRLDRPVPIFGTVAQTSGRRGPDSGASAHPSLSP